MVFITVWLHPALISRDGQDEHYKIWSGDPWAEDGKVLTRSHWWVASRLVKMYRHLFECPECLGLKKTRFIDVKSRKGTILVCYDVNDPTISDAQIKAALHSIPVRNLPLIIKGGKYEATWATEFTQIFDGCLPAKGRSIPTPRALTPIPELKSRPAGRRRTVAGIRDLIMRMGSAKRSRSIKRSVRRSTKRSRKVKRSTKRSAKRSYRMGSKSRRSRKVKRSTRRSTKAKRSARR